MLIEGTKISASSSAKINNYEYLAGEKILPYNQKQIILLILHQKKLLANE